MKRLALALLGSLQLKHKIWLWWGYNVLWVGEDDRGCGGKSQVPVKTLGDLAKLPLMGFSLVACSEFSPPSQLKASLAWEFYCAEGFYSKKARDGMTAASLGEAHEYF